jgi:hypothetical protein
MITNEQIAELFLAGYRDKHDKAGNDTCYVENIMLGYKSPVYEHVYTGVENYWWIDAWHYYQHNLTGEETNFMTDKNYQIVCDDDGYTLYLNNPYGAFIDTFATPRLAYEHFLTTIDK